MRSELMIQYKLIGRAMLLAAGLFLAVGVNAQQPPAVPKAPEPAQPPSKEATPAAKPVLEPKALDLLKAMSDRLAAAKSMSFTALATYEHPSRIGPALAYTTFSEVLMERPN